MKSMYKFLGLALLLTLLASAALGQRPRAINEPDQPAEAARTAPQPAPQGVRVKYEGGIFGYNKKIDGSLFFDDQNSRLLFRDRAQHEVFSIPYDAVVSAFADTQSKRPVAADVIGGLSIFTLPARFIKKKYRYLTLQYNDPDTKISGVTSFKMENKGVLTSVLNSLVNKAGLTPRGEVFVRRKDAAAGSQTPSPE
jgi:hypothetical protein